MKFMFVVLCALVLAAWFSLRVAEREATRQAGLAAQTPARAQSAGPPKDIPDASR